MVTPMTFTICKAKSPLEAVNTILAGGGETEIIPSFPRYGRCVDPLWDDLDFSRLDCSGDLQMLTHFPELVRLRASVSPEVRRALEQTLANCPKLSDVKIVERPRKPQKDGGDGKMAASDSDSDLLAVHKFCTGNKEQLMNGRICGCFYCLSIYDPKEIHAWIDNGTTGLCPYCGVDAILSENCGYPITKEFLQKMQRRWFDVNHN